MAWLCGNLYRLSPQWLSQACELPVVGGDRLVDQALLLIIDTCCCKHLSDHLLVDSLTLSVSLLPPISENFEDYHQVYCTFLSLSLTPDVADIQELQVNIS